MKAQMEAQGWRILAIAVFAGITVSCSQRGDPARGHAIAGASPQTTSATVAGQAALAGLRVTPVDAHQLLARVRRGRARATLVNVWATWCGPCREEFPALLAIARDYRARGLDVMLVSADFDSAEAKRYLDAQHVGFETFFRVGGDMSFIDQMNPRWSGALPASFVYDSTGRR